MVITTTNFHLLFFRPGIVMDRLTVLMALTNETVSVEKMNSNAMDVIMEGDVRRIQLHINALEWKMLMMGLWIVFLEETNLSK